MRLQAPAFVGATERHRRGAAEGSLQRRVSGPRRARTLLLPCFRASRLPSSQGPSSASRIGRIQDSSTVSHRSMSSALFAVPMIGDPAAVLIVVRLHVGRTAGDRRVRIGSPQSWSMCPTARARCRRNSSKCHARSEGSALLAPVRGDPASLDRAVSARRSAACRRARADRCCGR